EIVVDVRIDAEEHVLQDQRPACGPGVEGEQPGPGHTLPPASLEVLERLAIEVGEPHRVAMHPRGVLEGTRRDLLPHLRRDDAVEREEDGAAIAALPQVALELVEAVDDLVEGSIRCQRQGGHALTRPSAASGDPARSVPVPAAAGPSTCRARRRLRAAARSRWSSA